MSPQNPQANELLERTRGVGSDGVMVKPAVNRPRYGLIEWNGLSGFASFGLDPDASTGAVGAERTDTGVEQASDARCALGNICEPMN